MGFILRIFNGGTINGLKRKKSSVLAMEVEPFTVTNPKFSKWADKRLDATFGTRPKISIGMRMSGT